MTMPLMKPRRKNPVLRTRQMNLPPWARGRTALGMTAAAAEGRFELQVCLRCRAVQYPPRDACHRCLSSQLKWTAQSGAGRAAQRDRAPPQQRPVLPGAAAVAARPRAARRRADGDRAPAWRRAVAGALARQRRSAAGSGHDTTSRAGGRAAWQVEAPATDGKKRCASTSARASTAPAPRC
jgi:ribosomal protein L40E